jgi:hypothetical protein
MASTVEGLEVRDLMAFSAGPFVIRPGFTTTSVYNDNIYYAPSRAMVDDFLFMLSPALNVRLGRKEAANRLDFTYRFDQYLYVENGQSDSSNHSFQLDAAVAGSRFSYYCVNSFKVLNSILDGYTTTIEGIPLPLSTNVERDYFDTTHNVGYALTTKSRLVADASLHMREYPGGDVAGQRLLDSTEWRASFGYEYAITQKYTLDGRFHYGQQTQTANFPGQVPPPDASLYGGTVAVRGQFTTKLSGTVRAGYEQREFDGESESGGYPIAGLGLTYGLSERTSFSLDYNRGGSVSSYNGEATETDSAGVRVTQIVGNRRPWNLSAGVRYVQNRFQTNDQVLENWQADVNASYRLRSWAALFAGYSFEFGQRGSFDGFDYTVNQVSLGFVLGY